MEKITPYIDGFVNEIIDFKNLTPAEQVNHIQSKRYVKLKRIFNSMLARWQF